jgi:hypothetical protein
MRCAALALVALATPALAAPPQKLTNARIESRSAAAGLARAVKDASAGRSGVVWIGWSVPTTTVGTSCCWRGDGSNFDRCGCHLEEREGWGASIEGRGAETLEATGRVRILLRTSAGRVGRLRWFSEDCPLDAGGLPFVSIEDVQAADSVAYLLTLAGEPKDGATGGKRLEEAVIGAVAAHDDPSADAALDRFVAAGQSRETRKQAAFWMGQARGAHGYAVLKRLVRDDEDGRFREHAVFALSQSREPGAVDTILEVAKRDPDGEVRGQALFWLAQTAARRAPEAIRNAIENDPEIEVKKKAVFALSQLPKDEGVPLLINLAKTHKSYEVRKQAMFWLGQARDPRALAFFEDVLKN